MKLKQLLSVFVLSISMYSCLEAPQQYPNTYKGNFDALWNIIDKKYCYLDYKHVNWDSVYNAFKPRVDTVSNQYAFFDLMGLMLNELKDGHVNLISIFDMTRYKKWYDEYNPNFNKNIIESSRYLGTNYRISGGIKYSTIAGGKVGYMYYENFSSTFSDANISYIFKSFSNCKGLIIDVRNNGGGLLTQAEQMASYFFTKETVTGYIRHKTGDGHSDLSDPIALKTPTNSALQWQRPVVIVANRMSYSATNSFISRMKQAPNAIIVGDKSGGGGGLPLSSELPNGWLIRFSACPMYDQNMNNIEWGIDPTIKVDMNPTDSVNKIDTILETAIKQLLK